MPTPLTWTPDLIRKFWNGVADLPGLEHVSFSNLTSDRLIELMRDYLRPDMTVLDYGGGSGHLMQALIANGQKVAIYEPSDARANVVEERFSSWPSFIGAVGPRDEGSFDCIVCMEVIEHILDADYADFLQNLNKRLNDDGLLILTTPYNEKLDYSTVYCPECDSSFHRWQHVRTFDASLLRATLRIAGFDAEETALVGFEDAEALAKFVAARRRSTWTHKHREVSGDEFANVGAANHIFYVGRKKRSPNLGEIAADLAHIRGRRFVWQALTRETTPVSAALKAASLKAPVDLYVRGAGSQHVLANSREANTLNGAAAQIAVFDGEMADLDQSPVATQVRQANEIHVRDSGTWRRLVRNTRWPPSESKAPFAGALGAVRDKIWEHTARYLIQYPVTRRYQRFFDTNENALRNVLANTANFPYRATHYVPGRIALGISSLASGGAERQTVYMAAGLKRRGNDDVHLVVDHIHDNPANTFYLDKASQAARTIHEVTNDDLSQLPWLLENPDLWRILGGYVAHRILNTARHFHSLAPEVVQTSLDWTNVTMGIAAMMVGVPRILISGRNLAPSHFSFFNWFMYPAYRVLASQPNVILFNNSRSGGDDYADWLRVPAESVPVLRNAIDTTSFKPPTEKARQRARRHFRLKDDGPVIVGAFRLSAEKRPLLWVDTAAEVLKKIPNAQFLLFGEGPMSGKVQMRVHRHEIGAHVNIAGIASDIRLAFAAADLVLLTSLQEGTPNVLIEAQAMGLPVVTTPAFGASEAVEESRTGRIVESATPQDLSNAVVQILRDPSLRKSMSERGPAWAEQQFGAERMIDEMLALHARIPLPASPAAAQRAEEETL